jgi:hypothetical protein
MAADVFPAGAVELEPPPAIGAGAAILRWREAAPPPAEMLADDGPDGLYFHWQSEQHATVALWGDGSRETAAGVATDLLPGQGAALCRPFFTGDNPWPGLPPFPPSRDNPGLSAVPRLALLEPALRLNGAKAALILGRDAEAHPAGFALPDLMELTTLRAHGAEAENVAVGLARQALKAGLPLFFLDGRGVAAARLAQQLAREAAQDRLLLCDAERPMQARFRLNPLRLPDDFITWSVGDADAEPPPSAQLLRTAWLAWLRELGVTPAGLGSGVYYHTVAAVLLTALTAARRGLTLDPRGLRDVLDAPDFLKAVADGQAAALLGEPMWGWWLAEGLKTPALDVRLRLGRLKTRLDGLLDLPQYQALWRAPYLDPPDGAALVWRLPDPRRRLHPYVASQLVAILTLLAGWPAERPILIFLHELPALSAWVGHLRRLGCVRLALTSERVAYTGLSPATLALSRLNREDATAVTLPGVHPTDLRRLPDGRLILVRGEHVGTFEC